MATIFDVADWFLYKEKMTHKKLQKLCYYAQAWSCAICPEPISDAVFEAWVHGPVCYPLYVRYKDYGFGYIPQKTEKPSVFSADEDDFLEGVWSTYGDISANALEALSHTEPPWQIARAGLDSGAHSRKAIASKDMADYYRSIYTGGDA